MTDGSKLRAWCVALSVLLAGTAVQAREEVLFNGRDLTGWERSTQTDFVTVKDGAIMCRGGQRNGGWLHTAGSYADFDLHLEFRWGEIAPEIKAAGENIYNSGIFLRSNPGLMPGGRPSMMAYQAQVVHSSARSSGPDGDGTGDMWVSGYENPSFMGERPAPMGRPRAAAPPAAAVTAAPARPPAFRAPPPGVAPSRRFIRASFAEKPIGEWNTFDISVQGDRLTYRLNGELVNQGHGAMAMSGKIGLECENTPILFRNIRLTVPD
jgi:hypothetical protein